MSVLPCTVLEIQKWENFAKTWKPRSENRPETEVKTDIPNLIHRFG